jgi:hypothetical protein
MYEDLDGIGVAYDWDEWLAVVNIVTNLPDSPKMKIHDWLMTA